MALITAFYEPVNCLMNGENGQKIDNEIQFHFLFRTIAAAQAWQESAKSTIIALLKRSFR